MRFSTLLLALLLALVVAATANAQTAAQLSTDEFRKGRAYLEAKDYLHAIEHYNNSIAIMPSSGAYMDLGITYYHLKKYENSIWSFKQVVRMVPNNPEVHYWLALTYQTMGTELVKTTHSKDLTSFQIAESEAREALRLRSNYQEALSILGAALFVEGKKAEAIPVFEQALQLKPNDESSIYLLAIAYAKLGRKNEAMALYQRLAALDREFAADLLAKINTANSTTAASSAPATSVANAAPGSAEYYLNEGYKERDAKNYAPAIASFKKAIAIKPSLVEAHFNLGYCQYLLKQYSLALPPFQQAVRLQPNDHDNQYWLGATYFQLKRYQPALAALQESIRLKPDDAYSHHWLGDVYADGFGEYDKAIPEYREAVRLDPQYAIPYNQLGLAYSAVDEPEAAEAAFQNAIRLKPREPLYLSNLGLTYVDLGRREDAVAVQRKLLSLDPTKAKNLADSIESTFPADKDNPEFLLILAGIVSDRPETALPIYRRVLLLNSQPEAKAAAYGGMGDAFKAKQNDAKARAAYQQALSAYQRLLRLKPNEASLYYGLGHTYLGLGQKVEAQQVYRKLLTLNPNYAKDLLEEINKAN